MDASEVEESLFAAGDAKLHGGMCKKLSTIVCKVLEIFPVLEAARPRSKSGIQALCSLHVALDKAKNLLQHCSNCSKLYLAVTGDSILVKFEKARCSLQESLHGVEDIVPQAIGCQIMDIVTELEEIIFTLDHTEKKAGDELIQLLQKGRKINGTSNDSEELEIFFQAVTNLGILSSRAALSERRALKKLVDRARAEDDKLKESIVAYLLHLLRKYSKLFRNEVSDDNDSQGSAPCSPTVLHASEDSCCLSGNNNASERYLSKISSFSFKPTGMRLGNMPVPPEEFRCPISLQLMYDPVIISSGQTYERVCIEKWFNDGHHTCPKSQQHLSHLSLTPNYCVKGLIASWCEQYRVPYPEGPPDSLDLNYWRLALSECDVSDPGSIGSCKTNCVKVSPVEDNHTTHVVEGIRMNSLNVSLSVDCEVNDEQNYETLLASLGDDKSFMEQLKAVEKIRFLLKDDEEARICMGANGFTEALVKFLKLAIKQGDEKAQEIGAMALFNLAVNNDRNKGLMLSAGVIPLLGEMISNSAYEAATALYLNLSCLDDAKSIIGLSEAVPFLVQLLSSNNCEMQCKADALHTLYCLSTMPSNIPSLLSAGTVSGLHSLITGASAYAEGTWSEKAIAILVNLVSSPSGKKDIMDTTGLLGAITAVLDTGEPSEQEKAVSCLLLLCEGDQKCCHMVLQEGVIPALVSASVNGTSRGKEKAQKLLMIFREQRQREPSPARVMQPQPESRVVNVVLPDVKPDPLRKSASTRLGRTITTMWKNKQFSVRR